MTTLKSKFGTVSGVPGGHNNTGIIMYDVRFAITRGPNFYNKRHNSDKITLMAIAPRVGGDLPHNLG